MVKSMSGFGSSVFTGENFIIAVEIKSVNQRFFECNFKIPQNFFHMEHAFKKIIQKYITRGRVDVHFFISEGTTTKRKITVNWNIINELKNLINEIEIIPSLNISDLLAIEGIAISKDTNRLTPETEYNVINTMEIALKRLITMRHSEGNNITADLYKLLHQLQNNCDEIEYNIPKLLEDYKIRLSERLQKVIGANYDPERLLAEVALLTEKTDVNEELVRFQSHITQFHTILEENDPIGRKLDFLIQEMIREVNTIGSKVSDISITQKILEIKIILEKAREQVQNIE